MNWLGAWNGATSYAVNDVVTSGGILYSCKVTNVNQQPPNANWNLAPTPDTLTFTTLAPQPSARYAAPEAVQQLALVRYALEWDGGNATLSGGQAAADL